MISWLDYLVLFAIGASIGSYLNVANLRFSEKDGFKKSFRGKSRCPHCHQSLKWYELVPLLSYLLQQGKCRNCGKRLSLQYPIVELLSGLIFVLIAWQLGLTFLAAFWILVFLILLLIALIDLRLGIIPDKLNLFLLFLAVVLVGVNYFGLTSLVEKGTGDSFLGSYGFIFAFDNLLLDRLAGILFSALFLGGIYFFSRGRAIGLGDVKLAGVLGLLLGWPDIMLALILPFLVGSLFVLPLLLLKRRTLKDALPFGPFMVLGVTLVFFFGYHILNGYFRLFSFS